MLATRRLAMYRTGEASRLVDGSSRNRPLSPNQVAHRANKNETKVTSISIAPLINNSMCVSSLSSDRGIAQEEPIRSMLKIEDLCLWGRLALWHAEHA